MLIPCRPSAFDLSAIQTTAKLVQLLKKPAYVVFTAGNPNDPRIYEEAAELVEGFGTPPCPIQRSPTAPPIATPAGKVAPSWNTNLPARPPTKSDRSTPGSADKSDCRYPNPDVEGQPHEPQVKFCKPAKRCPGAGRTSSHGYAEYGRTGRA